MHQLYTRT